MKQKIIKSIAKITKLPEKEISNLLEIPPNQELGDFAFPCFTLAKKLKKNPAEIAKGLAKKIKAPFLEKIETKGPYINFFLDKTELAKQTIKESEQNDQQ